MVAVLARTELESRLAQIGLFDKEDLKKGAPQRKIKKADLKKEQERYDKQRTRILKEAKKNQKHYLAEAGKNKKWFECPRQTDLQYAEFVFCDKKMMTELLERNSVNRNVRDRLTIIYARDMAEGRWIPTDEAVSIDTNHNLGDGQHRCLALIHATEEYDDFEGAVLWVTFNVLPQAKLVIDSGAKRNVRDKFDLVIGRRTKTKLSPVCRAMMRGARPSAAFSESQLMEFLVKHGEVVDWAIDCLPKLRSDVIAAVAKASFINEKEDLENFCQVLRTMTWTTKDCPVKALYKFLVNKKHANAVEVYKKTLNAIEHYQNDSTVRTLYARDEDIFEWDDNWEPLED